MTTSTRMTYPKFKAWDPSTQQFLSGGLLYTYARGTTTNKATYSDVGMTTANANPVVLDSYGEATVFLDGTYKFVLKDSAGTTIWTQDDINVQETGVTDAGQTAFGIIANGSFEIDSDGDGVPDNWTKTTQGTVALDATDAIHGAQSYKFTSTGSGGGYITSDFFEVSANNSYSIIFSVKSSVVDVRNLVTISWYDLDKVIIAGSPVTVWDESAANPTSWTEKRFSVTPAAGACYAKLILYGCHSSDATSGNTKYDYVRMFDERADSVRLDSDGAVSWVGKDSANNDQTFAKEIVTVSDSTSGSEDATWSVQTVVAGTVADRIIVGQGQQVGSPTGGDKGSGTLNLDNDLYKDGVNITTPITKTNFVQGHVVYLFGDTPNSSTAAFDVDANIGAAWESVGPTGSGATNIWTALDIVPSTAVAVILFISGDSSDTSAASTTRTADAAVYARKNGSSAAADSYTLVNYSGDQLIASAATFTTLTHKFGVEAFVPVAATAKFDIYFASSGTPTCNLFLKGWVDSLI